MIAVAAPSASIDRLFVTDAVAVGAIHRSERVVVRAGGKGLNAARAAHALGADVVIATVLAGHAGRWIEAQLRDEGVRAEIAWADGETRSCLSVAAAGAMTEFYERGAPIGPDAWAALTASIAGLASRADWLAISGSLPADVDPSEATTLVRAARAAGARVAVDQHSAALAAALDAGPELVKVNHREASDCTGEEDPARALAGLHARQRAGGAQRPVTVVTLGEEGAVAQTADGVLRGRLDVRGPYPTGSGDAFLGGLLAAAPPDGGDWRAALCAALGAACANAEAEGAGTLDSQRARALAGEARVSAA